MIKINTVTGSVRERLLSEFDLIDEYFSIGQTVASKLDKMGILTKLDQVVLKSTLLFDSDYIDDLSSSYIKKKIHDWALHEIGMVTTPVANILTGELSDRKRELEAKIKKEKTYELNRNNKWMSQPNHGRSGTKKIEEAEKKKDRELVSLYNANLKLYPKYTSFKDFVYMDGGEYEKEKEEINDPPC